MMEEYLLCRTCLSQDSLNPIFSDFKDYSQYSNAIFFATGLKIEANDGLPQNMCTVCVTFLNNYLKFRKKCKDAETTLLNIRKKMEEKKIFKETFSSFTVELSMDTELKTEHENFDIDDDKPLKYFIDHTEPVYLQDIDLDSDSHIESTEETEFDNDHKLTNDVSNKLVKRELTEDNVFFKEESKRSIKNKMNISETFYEVVNTDKNRVVCKICQKELSIRSIDAHMARSHPGVDDKRVKCELCDKYVTRAKLNRHMLLMHGPGTFKCGYCKCEHGSRESLIEHVVTCAAKKKKRKPSETSRALQECDVCHKIMQRASLRMHKMTKHAGLRPVCEHCGLGFGNKLRLHEHYRAKHGYDKFKCSYCEFQSAGVTALRNHERRHRGEKPFVCETCGAKFHAAYLLAQHKQSHRTEKLVKCDLCPATFKANNSLHTHKLTCHNTSVYKCCICGRAYRCRHYAVKHARLVHRARGEPPVLKETIS